MSQIEVVKLNQYVETAPPDDEVAVSKLVMYALLMPGGDDTVPTGQGHCYSQIIRRNRR
jgi:hypothetical protein